jgi:tetratricopeptide (TPR) repeat protein
MVRLFCIGLSWFFLCSAVAQSPSRIDSLRKLLPGSTEREQFDLLSALAWEYRLVIPDSAIQLGKRAYELGMKLELEKDVAKPVNFIGVGYEYKGSVAEAYDYYKQALAIATDQNDDLQIAYANNNIGRLFLDQGNAIKALDAHQAALSIFELRNDLAGIAYVYLNLAKLYQSQKDFVKAEDYFLKMVDTRMRLEKTLNISSLIQLGAFYRESGNLLKSDSYLLQADSLCVVRKNEVQRAEINFLLASNRLKEHKLVEAEAFAKKALTYSINKGINPARVYNVTGKIHYDRGNLTTAKDNFKRVLDNSKTFREAELKMDAHYYLFQIYSQEGIKDQKLHNENQYLALKDTLRELELERQLEKLKFQFKLELEQKKRENELLKTLDSRNNTIIRKQQILNSVYVMAMVVIVVIAFLQFRNAKIKNKLNIDLEKKQEKILRQSEELKISHQQIEKINSNLEKLVEERTQTIKAKNKLLTEYAYFNSHQIRGPLARILGLINILNLEKKDNQENQLAMLQQAGNELDDAIKKINKLIDDVSE